jgi:two-component system, OmpR family, alkaline phosphatase synthesis response regulator PhoP
MIETAPAAAGRPRIVVADDVAALRELVRLVLEGHPAGPEVLEAATGPEALDLIRRVRPALAILDVAMPGLSGVAVARALADDPATVAVPLVVCTAASVEVRREAGRSPGVCAVVAKPFTLQALRAAVDRALAARAA